MEAAVTIQQGASRLRDAMRGALEHMLDDPAERERSLTTFRSLDPKGYDPKQHAYSDEYTGRSVDDSTAFRREYQTGIMSSTMSMSSPSDIGISWTPPEIAFDIMMAVYRTSFLLNSTVQMAADHSVGVSYHITTDPDADKDGVIRDRIMQICRSMNLDGLNRQMAMDAWNCGNCFLTAPKFITAPTEGSIAVDAPTAANQGEMPEITEPTTIIVPPRIIPLSAIFAVTIQYEHAPIPAGPYITDYRMHGAGTPATLGGFGALANAHKVSASDIIHFNRNNEDASVFGSGLGQALCRPGLGYDTATGKQVIRPAYYRALEMVDDVVAKQFYAAQPKHFVNLPGADDQEMDDMNDAMNHLDPQRSVVTNRKDASVTTMSLETQGKFGDYMEHVKSNAIMLLQNPLIKLYTEMSFTFASGNAAVEEAIPQLMSYRRDHALFVEEYILRPIVEHEFPDADWDALNMRINWGAADTIDLESLKTVTDIASRQPIKRYVKVEEIFGLLQEAGINLTPKDESELEPEPVPPGMPGGPPQNPPQGGADDGDGGGEDDDNDDDAEEHRLKLEVHRAKLDALKSIAARGAAP